MKVKPLLLAAILAVASCRGAAHRPSVGLMATPPPSGRVIGFDPSVVGLVGAIGDTVYDSAGIICWVKYDTANTAWRPVPVSQMVTGDPSQAPGLQGPVGFVVTMNDGSKSWQKRSASSTDWVSVPTSGGGGIVDGGVLAPLSGNGSVATPLQIASVGWDATQWKTITGVLGTQVNDYDWSDFLHPYEYDITQGSHPCTQKSPTSLGVMQCPSGGTGTAYLMFAGQDIATGDVVAPIANMKTVPWAVCSRDKIVTGPTSGQEIWLAAGFAVDNSEHEVFFAIYGPHSTTVGEIQQDNGGSITTTPANSGGTIGGGITLGVYFDTCIINDVAGARVVATVNSAIVATSTTLTNQPTVPAAGIYLVNGPTDMTEPDALLYAVARQN